MIFIPLINYFDASLIAVRKTCSLQTVIRGIKLSLLCKHPDFSIRLWRRRRIEFDDYESVGNMIYFNLLLNRLKSNPLQLEERTYPVDFGYKRKYAPQEYFYLKEFYSQIIKTQNSLITLEKI